MFAVHSSMHLFGAVQTWLAPLWVVLVWMAALLVLVCAVYWALWLTFPKLGAMTLATTREGLAQPLFWLLLILGYFLMWVFSVIPYFSLGEDLKMVKDSGLTLISVFAMIQAVWTAGVSISEELEGRTALTLLSKPISRRQFVLGKFFGVLGPVALLFVLLSAPYLSSISYMVVSEAKETGNEEPSSQVCIDEMTSTMPAIALVFMQTVVMTSICVAIATRLPVIPNLVICFTVYILGNLVPLIVQSDASRFEIVVFFGRFLGNILPGLENFNPQAAFAGAHTIPLDYLAMAGLYCVLYTLAMVLVALALFEDRDLA